MELQTITQISKTFNLSTRALRYYEQIGLITSEKKEDYAYRVYSEETVKKLQQIVILRKLRIPLKQIEKILQSESTAVIIDTFCENLSEIDDEITALSTIRDIISSFITRLNESISSSSSNGIQIKLNLTDDTDLIEAVDSLTIQKIPLKEEKAAKELQAANEKLSRLSDRDVRIIYLPPMTVASIHIANGEGSEGISAKILDEFIRGSNLKSVYPAARNFGFNNPDGLPDNDINHGYERWISIPDDMDVPSPLVKKHLDGGLYAAHMIPMGAWEEWGWLHDWVSNSDRFDFRWGSVDGVCGWLEEHLNYWDYSSIGIVNQLDLLLPIKPKNTAETNHPQ